MQEFKIQRSGQADSIIYQFNGVSEAADAAARFVTDRLKQPNCGPNPSLALSGGSAPRHLNRALLNSDEDWNPQAVHWFWGDERAVSPKSQHSNYRMQYETLLGPLQCGSSHVHRIRGELGAHAAAHDYERRLNDFFHGPPEFDLILLGLGPDGHTASLFPGRIPQTNGAAAAVPAAPLKPHTERITLTFSAINRARTLMFFTGTTEKETAIKMLFSADSGREDAPFLRAGAPDTAVYWFIYGDLPK